MARRGVPVPDFNSYGARRGNHEIMVRGTFANVRIRNLMVPGREVLLHQALGQFHAMTGHDLPVALGRELLGLDGDSGSGDPGSGERIA